MPALNPWVRHSAAMLALFGLLNGCLFSAGEPPPLADGGGGTDPTGSGGAGGAAGGAGSGGAVFVPQLGMQIERMGRPLTSLMLNRTFEQNLSVRDSARDLWNRTSMDQWTVFIPEIAHNLGVMDSFDANCGNQFLADPAAGVDRYTTLAGILADDRVWLRLDAAICDNYLGVEGSSIDCGGRQLTYDVVDVSWAVLVRGGFPPVTDGIAPDPAKTGGTTFPYLAEPQ